MPLSLDGHWVLIAGVDSSKTIRVYDSLGWYKIDGDNLFSKNVNVMIDKLQAVFPWKLCITGAQPSQTGGIDCGYFTMANMRRHLNLWIPEDIQFNHTFRNLVLKEMRCEKIFYSCPFNIYPEFLGDFN